MSGRLRPLILAVLLLLVAGGAYFGWRHYSAAPADSTAGDTEPVSPETSTPAGDQPVAASDPDASTVEADLAPDSASPAPAAAPAPQVRSGGAPQGLNNLIAEIKRLHAACLEGRGCTEPKWWDITVRLYATGAPVHLQELYAAVSRSWRGHLEGGPSAAFDRELAITLMNRAKEWGH